MTECDAINEPDTANRFLVGATVDGKIRVMALFNRPLSAADALNLAAYLVALSGAERGEFLHLLDAIEGT